MNNETYEEIGKANELEGEVLRRYVAYMRTRWGNPDDERIKCLVGYASEWAERFRVGIKYSASDMIGQAILKKMGG